MRHIGLFALIGAVLMAAPAHAASYVLDFTVGPNFDLIATPYGINQDSVLTGRATFEADNNSFALDVTSFQLITPEKTFTKADLQGGGFGAFISTGNERVDYFEFHLSDGRGDVFSSNSADFIEAGEVTFCNDCVAYTARVGAPVPEPSSWTLMLGGFGLLGATARRRTQVAAQHT